MAALEPAWIDSLNARVWHAGAWSPTTPLRRHLDTHDNRRHAFATLAIEPIGNARITPGQARGPRLEGGVYRQDGTRVDTARPRRGGAPCDGATPAVCDLATAGTRLPGRHLYLGWALPHFGHALLESTARLWPLLERDRPRYDGVIAHHDSTKHPWPGVLSTALSALGVDPAHVTTPAAPRLVDDLDVPAPAFEFDAAAHPALARVLQAVRDTLTGEATQPHAPEAVYISRAGLSADHRLAANEAQVEAIVTQLGFQVFRPENHAFTEQVRFMRRARWVMGCAGTGLHNAAFAPEQARVVVLCQRDNAPGCLNQLVLDHACGHATDVVFCDEALGFAGEGHGRHPWWIAIDRLRAVLGELFARPVPAPPDSRADAGWQRYLTARGAYLARAGHARDARRAFAAAAHAGGDWSDELRRRDASCALALGEPAEAARRLAERGESAGRDRELAPLRARAAMDLGRPAEAVRILAHLAADDALTADEQAWYAEALEAKGDHTEALDAWEKAAARAPHQPRPRFRASIAADRLGKTTTALTHVDGALWLHPSNPNMHVHRARLLMKLDRPCQAADAFASAHAHGVAEATIASEWSDARKRCRAAQRADAV